MPNVKKRKTHHHHNTHHTHHNANDHSNTPTNNNALLSHEEIWDDSALLRSWNDAVAEYEYYHSICARGEDVESVLRRAEERKVSEGEEEGEVSEAEAEAEDRDQDEDEGKGEIEVGTGNRRVNLVPSNVNGDGTVVAKDIMRDGRVMPSTLQAADVIQEGDLTTSKPAVPKHGLTAAAETSLSATDRTLESIKMAYYWAGYYSGLYDGQKQVHSQPLQTTENPAAPDSS